MMIFKSEFQEKIDKELDDIRKVQRACEFLQNNVGLKTILKACLDLANNINQVIK